MIELKFVLGMLVTAIGFILMMPPKPKVEVEGLKNVKDNSVSKHWLRANNNVDTPESYAKSMVSEQEFEALFELIMLESNWKPDAKNPKSSAYGLGQLIDQTWNDIGIEKSSNFKIQLVATHKYVMERYGSWVKALEFRKRNGYY